MEKEQNRNIQICATKASLSFISCTSCFFISNIPSEQIYYTVKTIFEKFQRWNGTMQHQNENKVQIIVTI